MFLFMYIIQSFSFTSLWVGRIENSDSIASFQKWKSWGAIYFFITSVSPTIPNAYAKWQTLFEKHYFYLFNLFLENVYWCWLIKLYRFQVYNSIIHHLYSILCIYHPKSSLLHHHLSPPVSSSILSPPLFPSGNHHIVVCVLRVFWGFFFFA